MKNRLAVVLAGVAVFGLTSMVFAQQNRQSVPEAISLTEDSTVKLAGETELYKDAEGPSPLDRKVSIRVSNVPISVFLNSITTQAKINFIMSEEFANKKVTASLTRVTVREALDTLLRVHGLAYQRIGKSDSYVVTKRSSDAPDTITKIYTLSYISLHALGSSSSDVGSSSSSGNSGFPTETSSSSGTSGKSSESGGLSGEGSSNITGIIRSMLSPSGRIAVDARTNKLIITDVAEVFPQIENILAELDIKPPQILIEAQIVEVSKTSGLSLGFEYGGEGGTLVTATGPKRVVDLDYIRGRGVSGWNFIFPSSDQISSGSGSSGSSGSSSGESSSNSDEGGLLDFSAFNIVLRSLLTRGEAKYLGKPKVVTLNNQTATIQATTDATLGVQQEISGNGSITASTTSAERQTVGLTLNVTPQVNREGYVTLYVKPSYSDVASSGFDNRKDPTKREATTLVRVKNGQTVVIGGLLTSRETEQVRKVPLLGDVPILGWLFTSKTTSKSTTDLVIFITPTILAE